MGKPARRLALFGDIHGNLKALDAVLAAIADAGIEDAVCTGDIVLRGLEPEECINRVRDTGWPIVGGNTDRRVANKKLKDDTELRGMRPGTRTWTRAVLPDSDADWLLALPAMVGVDLGPHRVVIIHGDRTVPPGKVRHDAGDEEIVAMMDALSADVLVVAHTHAPMIREVKGRLVVNAGSVGEGTDDDHRPTWALLEVDRKDRIHAAIEYVDAPLAPPRDPKHPKGE